MHGVLPRAAGQLQNPVPRGEAGVETALHDLPEHGSKRRIRKGGVIARGQRVEGEKRS